MKRLLALTFLVALALALAACAADMPSTTEVFVIADQDGSSLSHYEYQAGTDLLKATTTYDDQQKAVRRTELEYGTDGTLLRSVVTVPTLDGTEAQVRSFATHEDRDADGRLVKITRTASDGEVVEAFYGYDEAGTLRGVVQRYPDGSLEMMDY